MCSLLFAKTLLFMLNYLATACYTFAMGKLWGGYVIGDVKAAWMQAKYCPGHWEAPEQEFDMVQALSSNEVVLGGGGLAMYPLAVFSFLYKIPTPRVNCKIKPNKNTLFY